MTRRLDRDTVVRGLTAEFRAFADLLEDLSDTAWNTPTRCSRWLVRDVAAHVLGNVVDVAQRASGTRSPDEQAAALRGGSPAGTAAALRATVAKVEPGLAALTDEVWAAPGPAGRTVGNGVTTLWYDAYVHADDVRAALGRPTEHGPGLGAALSWLCEELEGRVPLTLRLDGFPETAVGGGGTVVTGDPHRFVLVATGRLDAAVLGLPAEVNVHAK
ncbi:maleylpyruvate isomerase family mycothiol-dependent enzyme [Actinomadura logoneensis]|uniref:Maleylpyruvate isomerase family mycothiol-dependent enzyme n=1 Tax=Actinomadura logoneensis TaxID=2293572 RepID=A0A372JDW2_9ACTN|nr:maleylpyruvate isomerase family mycothiol-dependent enzyme [Actinomadura logoneensis]RFU38201.1 maleylpyruvate isomerase family mycothiol-dependent enzyme [Actinomadura logoneensis]